MGKPCSKKALRKEGTFWRIILFFHIIMICLFLILGTSLLAKGKNLVFTNREFILNSSFDRGDSSWLILGVGSGIQGGIGRDGGPALKMQNITDSVDPRSIAIQILHLPTELTHASFAFDYKLLSAGYPGILELYLMQGSSLEDAAVLDLLFSTQVVYESTNWLKVQNNLTFNQIQALQAAHDKGELVWIVFMMWQHAPNQFKAVVDNVSMAISGQMTYPTESGLITYIGMDEGDFPATINHIQPDAHGKNTIWSFPAKASSLKNIFDVAWDPSGEEIAFSSNHEQMYSAFHADVYGIKPDGSGLRRITNPPSKGELDKDLYPQGSVTGKILNNYGQVITFMVYIQGAAHPISLDIGHYGDVHEFTINNVADLGDDLQYVVFMWSGFTACANGREYNPALVNVVAGEVTDVGILHFNGICGSYHSTSITWKRDGEEILVGVIAPRLFQATGEAIGTDLSNVPLTANKIDWSPVDDRLLYSEYSSMGKGIYLSSVGGGAGTRLVATNSFSFTPTWLPDGSGFIYTVDNQLRQYLFSGPRDTLLAEFFQELLDNPSPSPCGGYIVFQRSSSYDPNYSDLWVIDRSKPNQVWPLSNDGKSINPDWSRVNVTLKGP